MSSRLLRRLLRVAEIAVYVVVSFALVAVGQTIGNDASEDDSPITETTVIEPAGPPIDLDWSGDHRGRFPDPAYEIFVTPYWSGDRMTVHIRLNSTAGSRLGSLTCSDRDGSSVEGGKFLLDDDFEWIFQIESPAPLYADCRAVFDGKVVRFGIEWPNLIRDRIGQLDPDRSEFSQCQTVAGDIHQPTGAELAAGNWAFDCDRNRSRAWISPGEYWLNPQDLHLSSID